MLGAEAAVAGCEGEEEVAARDRAGAAHSADAEAHPLRQPVALVREQRRIGRDDPDDRAGVGALRRKWNTVADQPADRYAVDTKAVAAPVVGLHEDTDRVRLDQPRRRADAALEAVADHARAAADVPLRHPLAACGVERRHDVVGRYALGADVVEEAVVRLADPGQG